MDSDKLYLIFGLVLSAIQCATILANSLTVIAFVKVPSLRTQSSNILIYALSINDLFWGIFQLLYYGVPFMADIGPPLGEIGCMISTPLEYTYSAGNMILVAISIDRVLLVTLDYAKYVKLMTTVRLKITIAICFLICLTGSLIELSLWNYAKRNNAIAASIDFDAGCFFPPRRMKWIGIYVSLCFFILPLLLVGIFSLVFFKRLLVRINKTRQIGDTPSARQPGDDTPLDTPRPSTISTEHANVNPSRKRYVKSAVTLAALVTAMGISMLPYSVYLLVVAFSGSFSPIATDIMWLIVQLNPLLDPIFYAATQKQLRAFYWNKVRGLFRTFCY